MKFVGLEVASVQVEPVFFISLQICYNLFPHACIYYYEEAMSLL